MGLEGEGGYSAMSMSVIGRGRGGYSAVSMSVSVRGRAGYSAVSMSVIGRGRGGYSAVSMSVIGRGRGGYSVVSMSVSGLECYSEVSMSVSWHGRVEGLVTWKCGVYVCQWKGWLHGRAVERGGYSAVSMIRGRGGYSAGLCHVEGVVTVRCLCL